VNFLLFYKGKSEGISEFLSELIVDIFTIPLLPERLGRENLKEFLPHVPFEHIVQYLATHFEILSAIKRIKGDDRKGGLEDSVACLLANLVVGQKKIMAGSPMLILTYIDVVQTLILNLKPRILDVKTHFSQSKSYLLNANG